MAGLVILIKTKKNGTFRLKDDDKQVDFNIVFKLLCLLPQPGYKKSFNTYDIIGDVDKVYLLIKTSSSSVVEQLKNEVNDKTGVEIQYIRDQLTDNKNNLARLSAYQLRLPRRTKLTAIGQSILLTKCVATNVTFTAEITACEPQPKFQNFTMNL